MNSVVSNNLSLKYQRVTPLGWKDIVIRKFEFGARAQKASTCQFKYVDQLHLI